MFAQLGLKNHHFICGLALLYAKIAIGTKPFLIRFVTSGKKRVGRQTWSVVNQMMNKFWFVEGLGSFKPFANTRFARKFIATEAVWPYCYPWKTHSEFSMRKTVNYTKNSF